jgi:hypothetical protein
LPPVRTLFVAFLGTNPIGHLLGPDVLATISPSDRATLTGGQYFPTLVSDAVHKELGIVFIAGVSDRRR